MTDSPSIETQHGHPGIVLATLSLANVMALLDLFVVNVALHDIGVSLHYQSSLSDVAWVLNAYALFFGALLIPAGRFADKYGRKATFILGLAVFTVASLACAVSPDLWVLVGFRCVQAAGAAMIIPASLGLVLTTLPPDRVKHGVRVWAVSGAAAGSIGPVVGGLLTALSWRWIFVINLPIGIAAVLVTWKLIPNVRHDRTTRMPDLFGSLMIVVAIGAISLGLLNGSSWGWGSAKIIGSWVAAVAAAVAFVVSTNRASVPVIDLKMFRSRVFSASNIAIVIAAAILGIQLLGLSLFLQQSWHWPAITTGLALAPGPAAVLGASKRSNPDRARPATCRQACGANSLQSQTNIRTSSGRCTCAGDSRSRRASRGSIPTNRFCDYQTYPCLASPRRPCCMADSVSAQFTETSAHSRKRWRSCFRSDHPMSATGAWVRRTIRCQVRCDRLCQPQLALVTAITCPAYLTPSVRSDGGDGTQRRLCPTSMR